MNKVTILGSLSLLWVVGCGGSLVGGECADGYHADGELCVRADGDSVSASSGQGTTTTSSASGGGAGGMGEAGGTAMGGGDSTTSSGTVNQGSGGAGGAGGASASSSTSSAGSTGSSTSAGSGGAGGGGPSGSTGSGFLCFPPLAECQGHCENLSTDPLNCGGCGVVCGDGATCSDGICGGPLGTAPSGRAIVIGMNFAEAKLGDAQAVVLGNAIFSTVHEPVRAIDYSQYVTSGSPSFTAVTDLAIDEAVIRDRTLEAWTMPDPASVASALDSNQFDLLLVRDQDAGTDAELAAAGSTLAQPIASFTAQGGVVVVLATTNGNGKMGTFLSNALGFSSTPVVATVATLTNAKPNDPLGIGVLTSFAASAKTATLPSTLVSASPLTSIIVDPAGHPVVIANP